jgi:hypothetical protein
MGVAAEAKRAVNKNAAALTYRISERCFQRRSQQRHDFCQHDGQVQLGEATHPTSRPFVDP